MIHPIAGALNGEWLYFGCIGRPGHYVFDMRLKTVYRKPFEKLNHFDGKLAPQDNDKPYIATVTRLGGWGLTALSFWDYSVDKRGGCNSTFFAPSLELAAEEILAAAARGFPRIWERFPEPVTLAEGQA